MWFTRVSIDNPVFATMIMLFLLVLGIFSYQRMTVEEFPDVKFPVVVVNTSYFGASPEIVEAEVTRKIEEAVTATSGLNNLYSYSYEGLSIVVAEFDLSVNPQIAAQDVRESVAAVKSSFRKEVDEPTITRYNPEDRPIISVAVTSDKLSLDELSTRVNQYVQKQYKALRGVGKVGVVGNANREIHVLLSPAAMQNLGIGVDQVIATLKGENQELPVGSIDIRSTEILVQIKSRLPTPESFNRLVLVKRGDSSVYLGQVATVVDGEAERESVALVNGNSALTLDVLKVQGGNTIDITDRVRAKTEQLAKELAPEGIRLTVLNDASYGVRSALKNVRENLIEGALLTVVVVFLFLGSWRSTVITGLTLPLALMGTFYFLYIVGFTINVMTLMALSLCVGLLIDDAIVVRENIVRHARMGKTAYQATLDGTKEIGLAVLATTMSIVAVFLPVGFMGGIIGQFFLQFGFTVVVAVLFSMFVSFTLDPMLSSVWRDPYAHGEKHGGFLGSILDWFEGRLDRLAEGYARLIHWSLMQRKTVLAVALFSVIGAAALVPVIGGEFVPQPDMSQLQVRFDATEGASLEYTTAKVKQVEAALREFPEVVDTYSTVNVGGALGKNAANINLRLKPRAERSASQKEMITLFRARINRIAGITLKGIIVPNGPGGGQKPIHLSIQGSDFKELKRIAEEVKIKMANIPGVVELDMSLKEAKPTLAVEVDRDLAAQVGLSVERIGAILRPLIAGEAATVWKAPDGESYDVRVRLPKGDRDSATDLMQLPLSSQFQDAHGRPQMIPLAQVAKVKETLGPTLINRRAMSREIALTASLDSRPLGEVTRDIEVITNSFPLPPGYRFDLGGASSDMAESAGYAASALMLAVIFIYMVLASQFGSFIQPLAIMSSLPLSLIGVMLALLVAGSTLNIFSAIGVIMLMGLVTKNAILLVDFVNRLRRGGMDRISAIIEAGRVRLRPILMTTFAMIFGMLPLALSIGEGAEQRSSMAHAIIGGVITSTILTLVVVPVMLSYLEDAGVWIRLKLAGDRVTS